MITKFWFHVISILYGFSKLTEEFDTKEYKFEYDHEFWQLKKNPPKTLKLNKYVICIFKYSQELG